MALQRLSMLPAGLRLSAQAAPRAGRTSHTVFFRRFTHIPPPPRARFTFPRKTLWLVPLAGGLTLYLLPHPTSHISSFFSSPALIPCSTQPATPNFISSPCEVRHSILSRILQLLRDHIWEPIRTTTRFVHLAILFVPVIVAMPMLLVGKPDKRLNGDRWGAVWWYGLLVSRMQAAGPTFIKLAQWAASRADLFPALLCAKLGRLHSNGKPHSFAHTKRVIEHVFQKPFAEVFEEFDEAPIGTGAIAQVYRATLKKDLLPPSYLATPKRQPPKSKAGSLAATTLFEDPPPSVPTASVALKVLHPGVAKMIARDLRIMAFFAGCVSVLPGMEWLSLREEVAVFGAMMEQQLDLRHEAENLEAFERNFAPRKVPVTFPRPLTVWSTKDLLIEEYQNALPLEAFLKNGGGPFQEQIATVGLDAFLNMLLLDNFVHSDLHPGNIMIKFSKPETTRALLNNLFATMFATSTPAPPDYSHSDGIVAKLRTLTGAPAEWRAELGALAAAGYIPEIVFIDAGLVTTLNATNRQNFLDLFRAVAEFDGYRTGQLMVARCRAPGRAIETETFALKMQHLVLSVKRKTFSLGQIKISDILTEVLRAVRAHHVKMEGDFINTVLSILLLEGIGRQLDPRLDLFKSALPILRQLGREMSTQESMTSSSGNLGTFFKVWVWLEARDLANSTFVNADDLVKYGWLVPSI
ncbi:ABC1-domain-containing protein [Athelia psychrophila]|uniref:ABC1-domain-containing protein n=1 Tax=Athelia psychrophila TaxID=1759441 RepID=A0A166TY82_9AGAM|nr:ABC1-domain-containing protein [Fibularhizoctonia sp. CBS 109695]KZP31114.1 ABC1-domain-containing protein [Fibularhizoctonia sp. CBS 109695]